MGEHSDGLLVCKALGGSIGSCMRGASTYLGEFDPQAVSSIISSNISTDLVNVLCSLLGFGLSHSGDTGLNGCGLDQALGDCLLLVQISPDSAEGFGLAIELPPEQAHAQQQGRDGAYQNLGHASGPQGKAAVRLLGGAPGR